MNYTEFLEHIYKRYSGNVKLGLERMEGLLCDMGNPQDGLDGFHIAGTNGKGSVCASLEALALAQGLTTGLNTSPHLIDYSERFRINGQEPDFERLLDTFLKLESLFEKWEASFFEISTAIAFALFAKDKLDCAVIEVGLGGRLDATNLFTPSISAITNIGLDHVKTLGGTLELIANEKAGIIKHEVPLVLGSIEPGPLEVIQKAAAAKSAPVCLLNRDFSVENVFTGLETDSGLFCLSFDYQYGDYHFTNLKSNLLGEHQSQNLATALTCFIQYALSKGIPVCEDAIRHALMHINWRGRMQVISQKPVIILDGAHNIHGVKALINTLDKTFPDTKPRFLISILGDKDYSKMIELVCSRTSHIYVAANKSERAASLEDMLSEINKYPVPVTTAASVWEAFSIARNELLPDQILICGGSLYTVGEVLEMM